MSIYRIISITGGIGYKVDVTNAATGLRVIGIFPTEADATDWIAVDQEIHPSAHPRRQDPPAEAMLDRS